MIRRSALVNRQPLPGKRRKPRRGPMRNQEYMNWLKDRDCIACKIHGGWSHSSPLAHLVVDPAHTMGNGRGSKGPDSSCIPLCRHHHDEMDGRLNTKITTKAAFAEKYGLDLEREAAAHWAAFHIERGIVE